jgi:hypothetical protein
MKDKTLNPIISLLIFLSSYCNAQTSDFIVTKSFDTIYVEKVSSTDDKVKTITNGKKVKYNIDEIISYYVLKENKHYERVKNPLVDKIKAKQIDRYDYRALERAHIDDYEKRVEYKFYHRLTVGKVNLFKNVVILPASGNAHQGNFYSSYEDITYYISIYDSKLELINQKAALELTDELYELLKIYLHGNEYIDKKLEKLFSSKPIAKETQIINLINEYNIWVERKKQ